MYLLSVADNPSVCEFSRRTSVKFTRLDRIRDEIAELGDVAVSMETDVVNRQQVKKGN